MSDALVSGVMAAGWSPGSAIGCICPLCGGSTVDTVVLGNPWVGADATAVVSATSALPMVRTVDGDDAVSVRVVPYIGAENAAATGVARDARAASVGRERLAATAMGGGTGAASVSSTAEATAVGSSFAVVTVAGATVSPVAFAVTALRGSRAGPAVIGLRVPWRVGNGSGTVGVGAGVAATEPPLAALLATGSVGARSVAISGAEGAVDAVATARGSGTRLPSDGVLGAVAAMAAEALGKACGSRAVGRSAFPEAMPAASSAELSRPADGTGALVATTPKIGVLLTDTVGAVPNAPIKDGAGGFGVAAACAVVSVVADALPRRASVVNAIAPVSLVAVDNGSTGEAVAAAGTLSETRSPRVAAKPCATPLGRPIAPGNPAIPLPTICMQFLSRRGLHPIIGGSRRERAQLTVPSARMRARAWISFCDSTTVEGRTRSMIERTNGRTLGLVSRHGISPLSASRS